MLAITFWKDLSVLNDLSSWDDLGLSELIGRSELVGWSEMGELERLGWGLDDPGHRGRGAVLVPVLEWLGLAVRLPLVPGLHLQLGYMLIIIRLYLRIAPHPGLLLLSFYDWLRPGLQLPTHYP
jgi:hypothetical protein